MTDTCEPCQGRGYYTVAQWKHRYQCPRCLGTGSPLLGIAYAGIGSRETPATVIGQMKMLAAMISARGFVLRSGEAPPPMKAKVGTGSADLAFEKGCDSVNGRKIIRSMAHSAEALAHAAQYHPNWKACDEFAQRKHARNSLIMCGDYLDDPVKFVVCYTDGGRVVGGTGQALRIAEALNIPVFNLALPGHFNSLFEWLTNVQ